MARLNADPAGSSIRSSSVLREDSERPPRISSRQAIRRTTVDTSPGPFSDKENVVGDLSRKRVSGSMAPPAHPASTTTSKRRRLAEVRATPLRSTPGAQSNAFSYDPEQAETESLQVARNLRDIHRRLQDDRDEYPKPGDDGLTRIVQDMDTNLGNIKQTTHAKTDSDILVTVADLASRKVANEAVGDGAAGIDVDEFVSKCITFMRHGGPRTDVDDDSGPQSTQNRARRNTQATQRRRSRREMDDDDDDEEGDALAWDVLGELACFPNNSRPPVPGFLLGPLSVQKRARAPTQRRARVQQTQQPRTQPKTLELEDLERTENSNLTTLCSNIRKRLEKVIQDGREGCDELFAEEELTEDEVHEFMRGAHIASIAGVADVGVPLFEFAVNPHSFGQSVENLFYISFLIREGSVKVTHDEKGIPLLVPSEAQSLTEHRAKNTSKHQAVFTLNWPTWKKLIEAFNIRQPLIEHRNDEEVQVTARGWYG